MTSILKRFDIIHASIYARILDAEICLKCIDIFHSIVISSLSAFSRSFYFTLEVFLYSFDCSQCEVLIFLDSMLSCFMKFKVARNGFHFFFDVFNCLCSLVHSLKESSFTLSASSGSFFEVGINSIKDRGCFHFSCTLRHLGLCRGKMSNIIIERSFRTHGFNFLQHLHSGLSNFLKFSSLLLLFCLVELTVQTASYLLGSFIDS